MPAYHYKRSVLVSAALIQIPLTANAPGKVAAAAAAAADYPECLGPCHPHFDLKGAPDFQPQLGSAAAIADTWGINHFSLFQSHSLSR